jgi:glycosyltransferase involved in cell wall biosynthesis
MKILIITPHLSTGGAPSVTANKVKLLLEENADVMLIEYNFLSWEFVVQRNIIKNALGDKFISLGEDKERLLTIIEEFQPDVISMEEFPEMFMDNDLAEKIYEDLFIPIIETTHDSSFNPANKKFKPSKFVFVSAYSAMRYAHLDIPIEIIQYPVDIKKQDKEAKKRLGLDPKLFHVVIVGLWTPRKNQKYALRLAELTNGKPIQYHFIGNQAENFKFYWEGLTIPSNCKVWGERCDVDEFLNAADLFLFPSLGDSNNKELNPIVILEAMQYDELPKLFFNLDVYLGKYDNQKNVHFLSGDAFEDANKIWGLTTAKKTKQLIAIGTYPNTKERESLTVECLDDVADFGRDTLLVSHLPVSENLQKLADYYIYDKRNVMVKHSYYNRFFNHTPNYQAEIYINELKDTNQSLAVLMNLFNVAKFAKAHGYEHFYYNTFDVPYSENDSDKIDLYFDKLTQHDAVLAKIKTDLGEGINTNGMFFRTDFFLQTFHDVETEFQYNHVCGKIGAHNFLEDYLAKALIGKDANVLYAEPDSLIEAKDGVSSHSEYYSIIPVKGKENEFMFYFYTYNKDSRSINITVWEDGNKIDYKTFYTKNMEFMLPIYYNGKEIYVELSFFDGDKSYKHDKFCIDDETLPKFKNAGFFRKLEKPKVRLVHIQTTRNNEAEQKSREQLQRIQDYGIDYVQFVATPYQDLPPKFNCARPQCVSPTLFDEDSVRQFGTALTPSHFGCYQSFRDVILTQFENTDFLLICEGDCWVEKEMGSFVDAIYKAAELMKEHHVGYFSLGDTKTLEHGWPQSNYVEPLEEFGFVTNKIIGIQSIMFPSFAKEFLKEQFLFAKWDAADIFFNSIFRDSPFKMGIVHNRYTTQLDGYSLIDQTEKKFL